MTATHCQNCGLPTATSENWEHAEGCECPSCVGHCWGPPGCVPTPREELRAEIARLRDALEHIYRLRVVGQHYARALAAVRGIAREALR